MEEEKEVGVSKVEKKKEGCLWEYAKGERMGSERKKDERIET